MLRFSHRASIWTRGQPSLRLATPGTGSDPCFKVMQNPVAPASLSLAFAAASPPLRSIKTSSFNGTTVHQLQSWLELYGVDINGYGKGLAKTVGDLFEEAGKRESVLDIEDGRALRVVRVLSLHVINQRGQVLFEEEQILPDGRSRCRNVALSEKLIGDEDWRHAVQRAVSEELGSILPEEYEVTIFDESYKLLTHKSFSMSYPNLPTKYIIHRVSAKVTNIPQVPFSTFEPRPGGRLVTNWVWRSLQEDTPDLSYSST